MMENYCSEEIWIISDGGVANNIGYYGWVLKMLQEPYGKDKGKFPGTYISWTPLGRKVEKFICTDSSPTTGEVEVNKAQ